MFCVGELVSASRGRRLVMFRTEREHDASPRFAHRLQGGEQKRQDPDSGVFSVEEV